MMYDHQISTHVRAHKPSLSSASWHIDAKVCSVNQDIHVSVQLSHHSEHSNPAQLVTCIQSLKDVGPPYIAQGQPVRHAQVTMADWHWALCKTHDTDCKKQRKGIELKHSALRKVSPSNCCASHPTH